MPASNDTMDAIILAGGLGTRLREVVADVPKPLAPVNGRPFLDYQLAQLARFPQIGKVVLAIGHMADKVIGHYRANPPPLSVEFVVETELLGTGGGLRNALDATRGERVLALNGDSVFRWSLEPLIAVHASTDALATLALVEVDDTSRYGAVTLEHGRVSAFVEKQAAAGAGVINAGVYLFERSALAAIPPGEVVSLEREVFPDLCERRRLAATVFRSQFIDIGLPQTYSAAGTILPGLTD
jgi:NDP-sugar pyrophosphorylase family protein